MAIQLKTHGQIESMRRAGRVVAQVLEHLGAMLRPGITTEELDAEAERLTSAAGARCLFKGVPGRGGPFPGNICVSINEQVVHGIPGGRKVCEGEIVSIDFGVELDGWCGDAAQTWIICQVPERVHRLVDVTRNALAMSVEMIKPGEKWSCVARVLQDYVESEGFSVVREFVGHGIGSEMHEEPQVPNFTSRQLQARDIVLVEGMVLAIEPMVNMGVSAVRYEQDGWTVVTRDGLPSAHFEHTVAVTPNGADVLTDGR